MADEVKAKRPVPPQFLKKKKEAEQQISEKLPDPLTEIVSPVVETQKVPEKEIDMRGLIRDLMFNRYFHIMEKEAKTMAEKMVKEGSDSLREFKWFLAVTERAQLAKELKDKYGLS
jgi:hypothetical protein